MTVAAWKMGEFVIVKRVPFVFLCCFCQALCEMSSNLSRRSLEGALEGQIYRRTDAVDSAVISFGRKQLLNHNSLHQHLKVHALQ